MTCHIPLYRGDIVVARALVDVEDADKLAPYRWRLHSRGYAACLAGRKHVFMHRMIMGLSTGDGLQVDHVNRDRLDCRKANMRVVTHAENGQNLPARGRGLSAFRGVSRDARRGVWIAQAKLDGRNVRIGQFATEDDAARAAAAWRAVHFTHSVEDQALLVDPSIEPQGA